MHDIFGRQLLVGDFFSYVIRTSTHARLRVGIVTAINGETVSAQAAEKDTVSGEWKLLLKRVNLNSNTWIKLNRNDLPDEVTSLFKPERKLVAH